MVALASDIVLFFLCGLIVLGKLFSSVFLICSDLLGVFMSAKFTSVYSE